MQTTSKQVAAQAGAMFSPGAAVASDETCDTPVVEVSPEPAASHLNTSNPTVAPVAAESRFPRSARLLKPEQFSGTLGHRAMARNARFALHLRPRPPAVQTGPGSDLQEPVTPDGVVTAALVTVWRLGLVVPKRFEADAVRRNAIKRVWRESFRLRRADLEIRAPGHDLVVRLLARPEAGALAVLKRRCHADSAALFEQLLSRLARSEASPPVPPPALPPAQPCAPS